MSRTPTTDELYQMIQDRDDEIWALKNNGPRHG
jgi:hypothetical protein